MSVTKKKRAHKVSKGINGQRHHPLTEVEKTLLDKGVIQRVRHIECHQPWRGVSSVSHPYDAEQAKWNEQNLPFLFGSDDGRSRSRR